MSTPAPERFAGRLGSAVPGDVPQDLFQNHSKAGVRFPAVEGAVEVLQLLLDQRPRAEITATDEPCLAVSSFTLDVNPASLAASGQASCLQHRIASGLPPGEGGHRTARDLDRRGIGWCVRDGASK